MINSCKPLSVWCFFWISGVHSWESAHFGRNSRAHATDTWPLPCCAFEPPQCRLIRSKPGKIEKTLRNIGVNSIRFYHLSPSPRKYYDSYLYVLYLHEKPPWRVRLRRWVDSWSRGTPPGHRGAVETGFTVPGRSHSDGIGSPFPSVCSMWMPSECDPLDKNT